MARTSQRRIPFAKDFIRIGFGEVVDTDAPFYSHNFLTQELSTEEAVAVIPIVAQYNNFVGGKVAEAIARFNGRVSGWKFGAAMSPLLVVVLAPWSHQVENSKPGSSSGRQFTPQENQALIEELRAVFIKTLAADTFEKHNSSEYEYAAWWD